ncbi:hypothetical protein Pve01_17190 [Planomonospora venezuelensis]|uniref:Uncharacterized protein n=1 Tax=Planomonospora venezuelensis TaxID=1999 RepID=A0A841D3V8_PLAVE|nr:hypothetical protein [Planomonospora venezuelensis]GIN00061.1 hypothetical protein Pve01_17190 [Planomonospora venezuelensis]
MRVDRLDRLVLTAAAIEAAIGFSGRVLGMEPITFGRSRRAPAFGDSKIDLHEAGREFEIESGVSRRHRALTAARWRCRADRPIRTARPG